MSFARYFKLSSYCLIGSGYVAIAATGTVDVVPLTIFGCAFVASWFTDTGRLHTRVPPWALNAIALAYFPLFFFDYKVLSHSFVASTIRLVFIMAAVKVLTLARDRDYAYMYLISFAQLLAASTLTIDITFALSFFLFLVSGVSTLTLFEMRRSNTAAQKHGTLQPLVVTDRLRGTGLELFSRFPVRAMFGICLGMTVMILLLAVPLFFLLPRITLGVYSRPGVRAQLLSGFSEKVELGILGTIKESDAVVMRVKVTEPPEKLPKNLKWRGIALDHYDGRTWSRSNLLRYPVPIQGEYFKLEGSVLSPNLLWQTFFLEALSTDVVFASHKVLAVSRDLRILQRDSSGSLYALRQTFNKQRYMAVSDPTVADPALASSWPASYPDEVKRCCLQLPPEDPRIGGLAKEVTRAETSPFGKARVLESYLRANYGYSLVLKGSPNSKDPLAMFLFDVREGHCEYFASAMAIMLRHLGIPARLVNGFRAGEYNRMGDNWTVRQYDAHSWVEAYFPPYGWVEFDPTPPDPRHPRSAFARLLSDITDAVDLWWWEEVVNYDLWKQYRFLTALRSGARNLQANAVSLLNRVFTWGRAGSKDLFSPAALKWLALILPGTAAILILLRRTDWGRRLGRLFQLRVHRRDKAAAVRGFYAEALDLLASHGHSRGRDQTPLEFARSLGSHPGGSPFAALTQLYNRSRFGSIASPGDPLQAHLLLNSLKETLRAG